jgi:hypothetical protein
MPPRYSYWTIIADGLPTAFRAAEKEELLPTFSQIRQKHPDAQMKWFARGKLWDSPDSARRDAKELREKRLKAVGSRQRREWRPGGEHRDPRQRFKDAKKARNLELRRKKFDRRQRFAAIRDRRFGDSPPPPPPDRPLRARRPREGSEPPPPPHPSEPVMPPPGRSERVRRRGERQRGR